MPENVSNLAGKWPQQWLAELNQEGSKEMKKMKLKMKNGLKNRRKMLSLLPNRRPSPENEELRAENREGRREQWLQKGGLHLRKFYKL